MIVRNNSSAVDTSPVWWIDNFPPSLLFKNPRSNALVARNTRCPLSPRVSIIVPSGWKVCVPYHFSSVPGPWKDQCPVGNLSSKRTFCRNSSRTGGRVVTSFYVTKKEVALLRGAIFLKKRDSRVVRTGRVQASSEGEMRDVGRTKSAEGKEEMTTQEKCVEEKKETNSMHEESDVSNRHMTWWKNAWWIRTDGGPHMRTARGRRRIWRAARRAAEQARDDDGVEETRSLAEEAEGEKWGRKERWERTTRQCSENTLHIVLHLPSNTTTTTTAAAGTAAVVAATRLQWTVRWRLRCPQAGRAR